MIIPKEALNFRANEKLPRFNHYVPEFILKNFARNGKICIFDKHSGRQFYLPPKRAMGEKDFNNVRLNEYILSFENRFTHVENLAAPVIEEIKRRKSLEFLDSMQTAALHMFVLAQFLRSKRRRLDQDEITNAIRKRMPNVEINPFPNEISDSEFAKLSALRFVFENMEALVAPLLLTGPH